MEEPTPRTTADLNDQHVLVAVVAMRANRYQGMVGNPKVLAHSTIFDATTLGPEALAQCVRESATLGARKLEEVLVTSPVHWR